MRRTVSGRPGEIIAPMPEQDVADYTRRGLDHLWIHNTNYLDLEKPGGMMIFAKGDGIRLTDVNGRTYIDAMSGLWVVNAGHGRTELARIAAEQMTDLAYVNTFAYTTPVA